ncbi:uncharacterized protein LTR77_000362 [Saxophila tyrrhenica]|uniref:YTH domain-containing protein n=1 Tax=Saxophila tyrrhenica TaxID=1690608 RepID=A0AAV9PR29_9PEZI|nr:hypothetical protein LTR77_000362 [Saxophila tyrrhenica]
MSQPLPSRETVKDAPTLHVPAGTVPTLQHPSGVWPEQVYGYDSFGAGHVYGYYNRVAVNPAFFPFPGQLAQIQPRQFQHPQQAVPWIDPRFNPGSGRPHLSRPSAHTLQVNTQAPLPALVPDVPRGPPRKPVQSGHAVWIGNLPVNATIHDLKDYCSRGAPGEIESVFLISKSNCAFANFNSHAACEAAMAIFRNVPFGGRRLVCRLRMQPGPSPISSPSSYSDNSRTLTPESSGMPRTPTSNDLNHPVIVGGDTPISPQALSDTKTPVEKQDACSMPGLVKIPERFFIIKSLTVQDLIASVNNGSWEAQAHNEGTLQEAFNNSENVYLVFPANKSGEFFGLARMTSPMHNKQQDKKPAPSPTDSSGKSVEPVSIMTPANDTVPSGKIYDDSVRGTIFWEADRTPVVDGSPDVACREDSNEDEQRKQFGIEWLSTSRVPFFRTRGLRNPWNGLKEVKIARDGTELEPNVGRNLMRLFCWT